MLIALQSLRTRLRMDSFQSASQTSVSLETLESGLYHLLKELGVFGWTDKEICHCLYIAFCSTWQASKSLNWFFFSNEFGCLRFLWKWEGTSSFCLNFCRHDVIGAHTELWLQDKLAIFCDVWLCLYMTIPRVPQDSKHPSNNTPKTASQTKAQLLRPRYWDHFNLASSSHPELDFWIWEN